MQTPHFCLETLLVLSSILQWVGCDSCALHRTIHNSGFHRELVTQLDILSTNMPPQLMAADVNCRIMFRETIPSGAYVDPYQLNSLKAFGGPDVLIRDKIDIEAAEFLSQPHEVLVYTDLRFADPHWTSNYSLPVHLRYHAVSDSLDFAAITFTSPEMAIRCASTETNVPFHLYKGDSHRQLTAPCDSRNQRLCDWMVMDYTQEASVLEAQVPVGRSHHYMLVVLGTTFTTVAGCLLLTYKVITTNTKIKVS